MTEKEWLACADPFALVRYLRDHPSLRKQRLLAAGCWRQYRPCLPHDPEDWELIVEGHEIAADTPAAPEALALAGKDWLVLNWMDVEEWALSGAWGVAPHDIPNGTVAQIGLVRDIFGNPFRPVTFAPSWRTDIAIALGRQMYESRDFSAMPILADALQDAGCESDDVLNHCREPGEHVRGCWVVDLVLGKS